MSVVRPEFDPELKAGLAVVGGMFPPTVTLDILDRMRQSYASGPMEDVFRERRIVCTDHVVAGHAGDPIEVSVLRSADASGPRPCVLNIHSGGLILGDRFSAIDLTLEWIEQFGVVIVTPEYRLPPEFGDPYPREDCYATLEWLAKNAAELEIRPDRVLVTGGSAGAGLAAGVALASRDRGGPELCGQVLDYPMLDDRGITASTRQFDGVGVWDRTSNETAWTALLGEACGGPDVSPYAAPARAHDLAGLPPALISVGSAEIFRDEAIGYASRIWSAGGDAELHVWSGAFHGCDVFAPHAAVSRQMIKVRNAWVERKLDD